MLLYTVVGARPQFIKAAAISRAVSEYSESSALEERIIHTGQHYDDSMSKVFFDELKIPHPWKNLEVGSGSHGKQSGLMMQRLEEIFLAERPDAVLTYGDTNSTLASALVATKLHIPIAHVEAGLRSYNRKMPEEINRVVTDHVSDLLFCPSQASANNLAVEGITEGVHVVGDVMYDALLFNRSIAEEKSRILEELELTPDTYLVATIHRAESTDDAQTLSDVLAGLSGVEKPIVFPIHPRTAARMSEFGISLPEAIVRSKPLPYLDMLQLVANSAGVITDSGGLQKEAYWLKKPCVTVRTETEWTELVDIGWNQVVGASPDRIAEAARRSPTGPHRPVYGEGNSSLEIVRIMTESLDVSLRYRSTLPQGEGK